MGDRNGGLRIGATRFRGTSGDRGSLWLLLAAVDSGIDVSVGLNPSRVVTAYVYGTTSMSWGSHHLCYTNTIGGNLTSAISWENATIFLSNQDGLLPRPPD